jgi:fumarate hydratase class II
VPIRLGQEFGAYALSVKRDTRRITQAATKLRQLGIGGTAAGTGLNAHPEYAIKMIEQLSEICQLDFQSADDLFESMQSMADMADYSGTIRTLAITLTRIANDLRLLASGPSTGLDEIRLPAVQPGSSIMPGKVNPVMAEMLNMAMFHIQGCDTAISLAAQAGQLELNVMMPIIAHNLFEMMQVCIGSINAFTQRCVRRITANPEQATDWLSRNPIIVTALNPLIGYQAGAEIVKQALVEKRTVWEIAIQMAKKGELRHIHHQRVITVEEIESTLQNLRRLTEGGLLT